MSEHSSPAADSSAFEGDDFSTPNLVLIAIVSTVLLLVTVLVLQVLYYGYQSDLDQTKVVDVRNAEADSALAQQRARLTRYAWTDQSAGLVTIPIERAMQLVVRDEAARQAKSAADAVPADAMPVESAPADSTSSPGSAS
jgi:hypothetical protein